MTAERHKEPKLDTLRELKQIEQLASDTREVLQVIDADRGEAVFLTVSTAITDAIRTLEGVIAAYRYNRTG